MNTVLHIITGLEQGGAEAVLFRLTTAQAATTRAVVVSMTGPGFYGERLVRAGVIVHALGMPRGRLTASGVVALYKIIREARPDVVQTWMYHADLVGGLAAFLAGSRPIVWGIRNSSLDPRTTARSTRWTVKLCAWLSRYVPSAIICCSEQAAALHARIGYASEKLVVVPNGYDLSRFRPDREAGLELRRQLSLAPQARVVGCIARWDPQKDHPALLRAFKRVLEEGLSFKALLVGPGIDASNRELVRMIDELRLRSNVILLGARDDIPAVANALDWHVLSSSYGEAFPNVVAESMACGVPNVVTDVGDSALIVGDCGIVARPGDVDSLAAAIERAIRLPDPERLQLGTRCRDRIAQRFDQSAMTDGYERVWRCAGSRARDAAETVDPRR